MKYQIYKLEFSTGVHFGGKNLADAQPTAAADTLFSALCQEYVKQDGADLADFVERVRAGKILLSDTFPYVKDELYLPKPMLAIERNGQESGDSIVKKAYKKLSYIPVSAFDEYLRGDMDVKLENKKMSELGKKEVRTNVAIRTDDPSPYRVGVYYFNENCGIYTIVGYEDDGDRNLIEELFVALGYTGIGGKHNAGLGKFEPKFAKMPPLLEKRLKSAESSRLMSLSVCLPTEQELPKALEDAQYKLCRRSGFVASGDYADEQRRKRDLYVFAAGSCFEHSFEGDVYDVGSGGKHKVYRYAKPMFVEL